MSQEIQNSSRHLDLHTARRVVIKLGTSLVTNDADSISTEHIGPIAREIATLRDEGRQVVLVSSGAVGLGAGHLGLSRTRLFDVVTKQACAAVGQSLLMQAYALLFSAHKIRIAQILLTEDDFADWRRYQNLRCTLERLLKLGVLPIVNENDTVSIAELETVGVGGQRVFSDNDRLAALVMSKVGADVLVLLTNVDGLLTKAPNAKGEAVTSVVPFVSKVTVELKALASGPTARGRGGMITKLEAAEIAMRTGIAVIANGTHPDTLPRLFRGVSTGTVFASASRMRGKRRWIAFAGSPRAQLIVNEGARDAILNRKASLLASGVVRVQSEFTAQEVVSVVDSDGREFARGIPTCDSREAQRMIVSSNNRRQRAKEHVLVSRDNIVLTHEERSLSAADSMTGSEGS
jgi:glutamate 5-kinase